MARAHYDELLRQLDNDVLELGTAVADSIGASMQALTSQSVSDASAVVNADDCIDEQRHAIEKSCFTIIATQQPAARDLRIIVGALTTAAELERIGDYSEGIAKLTLRMAGEPVVLFDVQIQEMAQRTENLLRRVMHAYGDRDVDMAAGVWSADNGIDAMYGTVFRDLLTGMAQNTETIRTGTYMLWVAHNLERIADRASNIAESVAFIATGDVRSFRETALAHSLPL